MILLDDNSLSRQFALETGAPQGNAPSPLQYNFCEQIALIKIELDPRIASVYNHMLAPRIGDLFPVAGAPDLLERPDPAPRPGPVPAPVPLREPVQARVHDPFALESNRETDKVESFADDKTATFRATGEGLAAICEILENFASFSGLRCNMEKSAIMYVGDNGPPPPFLAEFEFSIVDNFKLLGIDINKNNENLSNCHTVTILRLTRIINFWERFYLSLPGRINIAKTLLLSQINYLGCIITPDPGQMRTMKNLIEGFIVGRLNIAKDRICRPSNLGGLGMIDVEDFISAQQVVWVKRAAISLRDNWRVDMNKITHGNVYTLSGDNFGHADFPIFVYIAESLRKFLSAYGEKNDNFSKMYLANNPLIKRGRNDNRLINSQFFSANRPLISAFSLNSIRIDQIATRGHLFSLDVMVANTGIEFSLASYLRLQEAFFSTRHIFAPARLSDGTATLINNFLKQFKKGSKPIRNILLGKKISKIVINDLPNVKSLGRLSTINNMNDEVLKRCLSFWNFYYLPMKIREFSFKFFNNSLGLNNRLAHFVPGRENGCTFCSNANMNPVPVENFMHLFYECNTVKRLRTTFENEFLPELQFNNLQEKIKFWIFGVSPTSGDNSNYFMLTLTQVFLYSIWQFKLQKRTPVRMPFEMEFFSNMSRIVKSSFLVRNSMTLINVTICRNWEILQHRRG